MNNGVFTSCNKGLIVSSRFNSELFESHRCSSIMRYRPLKIPYSFRYWADRFRFLNHFDFDILSGVKQNLCTSFIGQETVFGWRLSDSVKIQRWKKLFYVFRIWRNFRKNSFFQPDHQWLLSSLWIFTNEARLHKYPDVKAEYDKVLRE